MPSRLGKLQTSLVYSRCFGNFVVTCLFLNGENIGFTVKGEWFMVFGSRFKVITENAKEIAQNIEKGAEKKMKKGIIKKKNVNLQHDYKIT